MLQKGFGADAPIRDLAHGSSDCDSGCARYAERRGGRRFHLPHRPRRRWPRRHQRAEPYRGGALQSVGRSVRNGPRVQSVCRCRYQEVPLGRIQEDAPGGLIYLPYDPAVVGREGAERSLVGALSGSEGIVSVLNREAERRGLSVRFSTTSRVVKEIYDRVQAAYDGEYDEARDAWLNYRTTFFSPQEIWAMAEEAGAVH